MGRATTVHQALTDSFPMASTTVFPSITVAMTTDRSVLAVSVPLVIIVRPGVINR